MTVLELKRGPFTFTGYITGVTAVVSGDIVAASQGDTTNSDAVTSSGKSSYTYNDITIEQCITALYEAAVGIALEGANTSNAIAVSPSGMYIVRVSAAVSAGAPIGASGTDPAEFARVNTSSWTLGKALTTGSAANSYIVALLDCA